MTWVSPSLNPDKQRQKIMIITTDESIFEKFQTDNTKRSLIQRLLFQSETTSSRDSDQPEKVTQAIPRKCKTKDNGSLTCVICGSLAQGYNFGAIACESCKAFFRRNAHKDPKSFKCSKNGNCEISFRTRRECAACRLAKCLKQGMQPDRLLTEEQKLAKRRKIEENQRLIPERYIEASTNLSVVSTTVRMEQSFGHPFLSYVKPSPSIESCIDWTDINDLLSSPLASRSISCEELQQVETISLLYQKRIELAIRDGLPWDPSMETKTFLQTLNSHSVTLMRLLSFFKQIPEFNQLNVDDKVTLIKYNLIELIAINCVLYYDSKSNQIIETNSDAPWNTEFTQVLHGYNLCMRLKKIFDSFLHIARHDQKIIHLSLIILIFAKGFSTTGVSDEPILNNGMVVYHAQNHYVELLWKYIETIHGYEKAMQLFSQLLGQILSWQAIQEPMRQNLMRTLSPEDIQELVPIMKSLLRIT